MVRVKLEEKLMSDRKEYMKQYYLNNKEHRREYIKQWEKNNPEYQKQWYQDNKEHCSEYTKKYRQTPTGKQLHCEASSNYRRKYPKKIKEALLKHKYNLSHGDWFKIWETQDGKCVICGEPFKNPSKACIDHNHKNDEIRGLLCNKCNFGIGLFDDNPKTLAKAIEYLLKWYEK